LAAAVAVFLAFTLDAFAATKLTTEEQSSISRYRFSPSGQWVVFSTYTHPEGERVYSRPILGTDLPLLLHDTGSGRSGDFVISPDSQWVVMLNRTRPTVDAEQLLTRRIDGSAPINDLTAGLNLPAYDTREVLQIVPATNELVVRTWDNGQERLHARPVDGATQWRRFADLPLASQHILLSGSEERVVYRAQGAYSVPVDGSAPPAVLSGGMDAGDISVTPDGHRVIFKSTPSTWYSAPVDGAGPLVALGDASYIHNLGTQSRATPDSSRFVFLSDTTTAQEFELYSRVIDASAPAERLSNPLTLGGDVANFSISPDSQWVAFSETDSIGFTRKRFLARADGAGDAIELDLPAPDGYTVNSVSFTPDSRNLLYVASRTDPVQDEMVWSREYFQLLSRPIDGSAAPALLSTNVGPFQSVAEVFVTPDGENVLFGKSPSGRGRGLNIYDEPENHALYVVPVGGGTPRLVNDPLPSGKTIYNVQITPDGLHVAYLENDGSDLFLAEIPDPSPLLPIPGDYDSSGVVDGRDYVIWRATLGQSGIHLAADGNLSGEVDSGDYDVWRANFGLLSAATGQFSQVPEPAGLPLAAVATLTCFSAFFKSFRHFN
jgi:Tol biopolymer transport system component